MGNIDTDLNVQPICGNLVDGCMTTAGGYRLCCNPEHTKDPTYKTRGPVWHHVSDWPKDTAGFCESHPTDLQRIAKEAIDIQDACNLSGVVRAMARATEVLRKEEAKVNGGTAFVNRHPIMTLYLSKLCSLNKGEYVCDYLHASDACERIARGEKVEYLHAHQ